MAEYSIYKDISERTGGDIYIGVVGPVRSGKSTFIKRFMESLVLPNIEEGYSKERARDEMPQSAAGKTVMTTEPKFIPDEAVKISVDGVSSLKVKMIDCVGYIIPEALGAIENGQARMVRTPWSEEPMPFVEAAEMGTQKVIREHSTIGMLVTTDGSIGDIKRESYVEAEQRIVNELKELKKPFAVILNSANPTKESAISLAYELEEKYKVPVALVSCMDLDSEDIRHILELVLFEFPVNEIRINMPEWVYSLGDDHKIKSSIMSSIEKCVSRINKTGDIKDGFCDLNDNEYIKAFRINNINLGDGSADVSLEMTDGLYWNVLSQLTGFEIAGDSQLIDLLCELASMKDKYDRVGKALEDAESSGYGIVMPNISDLRLNEPEIVKQSGGYGVKLSASAQSIHMIRANIETEISPMVGTEQQSEDLVKSMLKEFEADPLSIWQSNMFGKTLYELVNEGLHTKLEHMPDASRKKLSETLERIINEGSGGLICIIL